MKKNKYILTIESIVPYPKRMWEEILIRFLDLLEKQKNFSFENCALTLLVVKDNDMIFYNQEQMGVNGPTNILSFPEDDSNAVFLSSNSSGANVFGIKHAAVKKQRTALGTLILSMDTLLREAHIYGQNPHKYAIRLLAHGLVHLLGYEHGDDMWELTDFLEHSLLTQESIYTLTPFRSFTHG
jgi:probable rRNA maturation factor